MEGYKFPNGLRVLVVDDDPNQLKILERLLIKCNYEATVTTEAEMALRMLRENKDRFDIVISDVQMPGMDGFKLLELIGLELDVPVIMLSGDDSPDLVMKGVRHGAVDYLLKPVSMGAIKNIWQHVIRKSRYKQKGKANSGSDAGDDGSMPLSLDGDGNTNIEEERPRKRKEKNVTEEDVDEENESKDEDGDSKRQKKRRVVWSPELHKKFVFAVDQLGPEKAFPKKILDFMNVEGLTRENVASHLQKYRLYLKRLNSSSNQSIDAVAYGTQGSSIYMNGGSVSNSYNVYCNFNNVLAKTTPGQMNVYRSGLPQGANSLGNVGNPRMMNISHFHHQKNNIAINGFPSTTSGNQTLFNNVKPQAGILSLEDYTRRMERWKNGPSAAQPTAQQNLLTRNQLPSSSFNGGFPCNDISYFQNSLEHPFVAVSATPEYSFSAQNVSCNIVESQRWQLHINESNDINISTAYNMDSLLIPNIDPTNQSFGPNNSLQYNSVFDYPAGQISADGTSSFMQCTEVQDNEADALMRLDDSYLLDSTDLLDGFTQNNCETLEDLVGGLLRKDDL